MQPPYSYESGTEALRCGHRSRLRLRVERSQLATRESYAFSVKSVRGLLEHLRRGRRPPSGPLTTDESAAALARQKSSVKDDAPSKSAQER